MNLEVGVYRLSESTALAFAFKLIGLKFWYFPIDEIETQTSSICILPEDSNYIESEMRLPNTFQKRVCDFCSINVRSLYTHFIIRFIRGTVDDKNLSLAPHWFTNTHVNENGNYCIIFGPKNGISVTILLTSTVDSVRQFNFLQFGVFRN